jgi:hypothetical protein
MNRAGGDSATTIAIKGEIEIAHVREAATTSTTIRASVDDMKTTSPVGAVATRTKTTTAHAAVRGAVTARP